MLRLETVRLGVPEGSILRNGKRRGIEGLETALSSGKRIGIPDLVRKAAEGPGIRRIRAGKRGRIPNAGTHVVQRSNDPSTRQPASCTGGVRQIPLVLAKRKSPRG